MEYKGGTDMKEPKAATNDACIVLCKNSSYFSKIQGEIQVTNLETLLIIGGGGVSSVVTPFYNFYHSIFPGL